MHTSYLCDFGEKSFELASIAAKAESCIYAQTHILMNNYLLSSIRDLNKQANLPQLLWDTLLATVINSDN